MSFPRFNGTRSWASALVRNGCEPQQLQTSRPQLARLMQSSRGRAAASCPRRLRPDRARAVVRALALLLLLPVLTHGTCHSGPQCVHDLHADPRTSADDGCASGCHNRGACVDTHCECVGLYRGASCADESVVWRWPNVLIMSLATSINLFLVCKCVRLMQRMNRARQRRRFRNSIFTLANIVLCLLCTLLSVPLVRCPLY